VKPSPQVAVIVVSYNTRDLLLECLSSVIQSTASAEVEIVVVDNGSSDASVEAVRQTYPQVATILNETNLGFGVACNQAIKASVAPLILLLNSDARLTPESFDTLCDAIRLNNRCGAAGCRIVNSDGVETTNTRNFLTPFNQALELLGFVGRLNSRYLKRSYRPNPDHNQLDCKVDWVDGACLMLRRLALDEVGIFDEQFFMYSEDEDLCFRLRSHGWTVCYSAGGSSIHHGAASTMQNKSEMLRQFYSSQILFLTKHRGKVSAQLYLVSMKTVLLLKRLVHPLFSRNRGRESAERLIALSQAWSSKNRR
jgi:GT2 family glycosyltransferase